MIASKEMVISFLSMLQMLVTVIFIPIIFVEIIRYLLPRLITPILKIRFPVSLLVRAHQPGSFFPLCNLFQKEPSVIILSTVVALALATIYYVVGLDSSEKDRLIRLLEQLCWVIPTTYSSLFFLLNLRPCRTSGSRYVYNFLDDSNPSFAIITIGRHNLLNLP